jgi:hypothetical protein
MEQSGFYIELTEGKGRDLIRARVLRMGEHILIAVGGGQEHIGAAALAEPGRSLTDKRKTTSSASVITRFGHKEDLIAREIAMSLASFLNQPVLVCCGIHFEHINGTEIANIEKNIHSLIAKLKIELGQKS